MLIGNVIGCVDVVGRAGDLRKGQSAGDVVVVDVGLEDVGDEYTRRADELEHAVDVTLRVDHERDLAVMDEVAAVPQGRGLDGDDGDHQGRRPSTIGCPARAQAPVPPVTEYAS